MLPDGRPQSAIGDQGLMDIMRLARDAPRGAIAELGVWKGGSAYCLSVVAQERGVPLYLYDTFNGIPFKGPLDSHAVGDFGDTSLEAVKKVIPDAIFGVGVFPDSLLPMEPLCFVHVDADQEQSYRAAMHAFFPLLVDGGIMLFDDYNCLQGATLAVRSEFKNIKTTESGKGYVVKGMHDGLAS